MARTALSVKARTAVASDAITFTASLSACASGIALLKLLGWSSREAREKRRPGTARGKVILDYFG
jgi:hypothetical protein